MNLLLLNLLFLLPIMAWLFAKRAFPMQTWRITGACFGAIISLLSLGLYASFFVSPWGVVTGMLGLLSLTLHSSAGLALAVQFGFIPSDFSISSLQPHFYVEAINALVWGALYGGLGWGLDVWLMRRRCLL